MQTLSELAGVVCPSARVCVWCLHEDMSGFLSVPRVPALLMTSACFQPRVCLPILNKPASVCLLACFKPPPVFNSVSACMPNLKKGGKK